MRNSPSLGLKYTDDISEDTQDKSLNKSDYKQPVHLDGTSSKTIHTSFISFNECPLQLPLLWTWSHDHHK